MRTCRILLGAMCLCLIPVFAQGGGSAWSTDPTVRLQITNDGLSNLTDMEGDGFYGLLLGWDSAGDARAQPLTPSATRSGSRYLQPASWSRIRAWA